jgi:hypothetical protein
VTRAKPAKAKAKAKSAGPARKRAARQGRGPANTTPNTTPKKGRKPDSVPDWRPVFLKELSNAGNVSAAALKAKVDRATAYAARDHKDKTEPGARLDAIAFARSWDNAMEVAIDALEAEARRRAVEGVDEPVGWYKGEAGGKVRRYSDTLLIVLLKAHRPEKYRENIHQEHTGAGGGPIEVRDLEAVRAKRWVQAGPALAVATDGESPASG